eukprot:1462973-Pyramimonas_sp.AAC.1
MELTGALMKSTIKKKASNDPSVGDEWEAAPCCAAPTSSTKDEKSTDPQTKQQVQKTHENMGQCSNENLAMVLKYGKARQVYIDAAQELVCPSCEANKRPRLAKSSYQASWKRVYGTPRIIVIDGEK